MRDVQSLTCRWGVRRRDQLLLMVKLLGRAWPTGADHQRSAEESVQHQHSACLSVCLCGQTSHNHLLYKGQSGADGSKNSFHMLLLLALEHAPKMELLVSSGRLSFFWQDNGKKGGLFIPITGNHFRRPFISRIVNKYGRSELLAELLQHKINATPIVKMRGLIHQRSHVKWLSSSETCHLSIKHLQE